jgi:hypothetical protein
MGGLLLDQKGGVGSSPLLFLFNSWMYGLTHHNVQPFYNPFRWSFWFRTPHIFSHTIQNDHRNNLCNLDSELGQLFLHGKKTWIPFQKFPRPQSFNLTTTIQWHSQLVWNPLWASAPSPHCTTMEGYFKQTLCITTILLGKAESSTSKAKPLSLAYLKFLSSEPPSQPQLVSSPSIFLALKEWLSSHFLLH